MGQTPDHPWPGTGPGDGPVGAQAEETPEKQQQQRRTTQKGRRGGPASRGASVGTAQPKCSASSLGSHRLSPHPLGPPSATHQQSQCRLHAEHHLAVQASRQAPADGKCTTLLLRELSNGRGGHKIPIH